MKPVRCYSVRVKKLEPISEKAVVIETFDGSRCVFPKSQIFGIDTECEKCEAYWISEWILERKDIQWSRKKLRLIDQKCAGSIMRPPSFVRMVTTHIPQPIEPVESNDIASLKR